MRFCPLYSGSSGNALLVAAENTAILVDAGLPGRTVTDALAAAGVAPEQLSGLLVTHEHSDHVKGVGVLARRYHIPVYANEGTWRGMLPLIGEIPPAQMRVFETERDFYLGDVNVLPFKTPHDANESVGFVFRCGAGKLSILTDAGHITDHMLDAVAGSDLILIESNHDVDMLRRNPNYGADLKRRILGDKGHLSNDLCAEFAVSLVRGGTRHLVLGHLSQENNSPATAENCTKRALEAAGFRAERDYTLHVAPVTTDGEFIAV